MTFESSHEKALWLAAAPLVFLFLWSTGFGVVAKLGLRHTEPLTFLTQRYAMPPLSAVIAWPLLGEALPAVAWFGMAMAAAGVALASRSAS